MGGWQPRSVKQYSDIKTLPDRTAKEEQDYFVDKFIQLRRNLLALPFEKLEKLKKSTEHISFGTGPNWGGGSS